MKGSCTPRHRRTLGNVTRHGQGFTLVELLVAMAIALFLIGGLLTLVQDAKRTVGGQSQLVQLQDSERLAMTMITDVIQAAGYFPNPTAATAATALPVVAGSFATAGQGIYGQSNFNAQGDSITARYQTASGDGVINCTGTTNGTGAPLLYTNVFTVDAAGELECQLTAGGVVAAAVPLVTGLATGQPSLQIWYGVQTNGGNNGAVDSYIPAVNMTAANWMNVISVRVTLTFNNPLYVAGSGNGQPQTIAFTRVVGVMSKTGVQT
jgi:type IV pilus assembly protein PilW